MGTGTRFAFTKIFANDVTSLADFYVATLGLTVKARLDLGEGMDAIEEIILTSGRDDDSSLILWRYLERATPTPGEAVLGFNVPDIEETLRLAELAGGSVAEPPKEYTEMRVIVAFVNDPEGHLLEIVQNF